MTSTAGATNALDKLDKNVPTRFYWSLTLLATLGGFLFGYDTSNIGAALPFVEKVYPLNDFMTGYMVAGASLGAAAGALLAGPLTDRFGRKSLLVADALIYAIGALLSAFTWHVAVLLTARTLIGLAIGADSAIATAYISEYAPANRRGSLSMLQQWMITVGILVSYVVALVILKVWPTAGDVDWRWFFGLGAVPAIIGLVLRFEMPESPRWLLRKGRYEDAQKAFAKLEIDVSIDEIEETARDLDEADERQERAQRRKWSPGVKRALAVVCVFFVFQQITGINVPLYYGPSLLGQYFQSGHSLVDVTTAGVSVTLIMTAVNVIATYFAFRWIDRIGRRRLAMGGFAGMAVFAVVAAIGIGLLSGVSRSVVGMIGLSFFIASFAIGVGGTGWLIQGEMFPTAVRGQAAAIAAFFDWIANYALIEVFPAWQRNIGLSWVLVCFAGLCILAIGFVFRYLPETKQLSVEQITEIFDRQAAGEPEYAGHGALTG
ncbi:MAG TPA: sugar porter family MFS transporter [Jatrophihabitans sp.]|nr:sugar porter family MFS transporter [Jatrophihabitans sp.]